MNTTLSLTDITTTESPIEDEGDVLFDVMFFFGWYLMYVLFVGQQIVDLMFNIKRLQLSKKGIETECNVLAIKAEWDDKKACIPICPTYKQIPCTMSLEFIASHKYNENYRVFINEYPINSTQFDKFTNDNESKPIKLPLKYVFNSNNNTKCLNRSKMSVYCRLSEELPKIDNICWVLFGENVNTPMAIFGIIKILIHVSGLTFPVISGFTLWSMDEHYSIIQIVIIFMCGLVGFMIPLLLHYYGTCGLCGSDIDFEKYQISFFGSGRIQFEPHATSCEIINQDKVNQIEVYVIYIF